MLLIRNRRLQHFAPPELRSFVTFRVYKRSAPPELRRLVTAESRKHRDYTEKTETRTRPKVAANLEGTSPA
jgi:hypothetical protein